MMNEIEGIKYIIAKSDKKINPCELCCFKTKCEIDDDFLLKYGMPCGCEFYSKENLYCKIIDNN